MQNVPDSPVKVQQSKASPVFLEGRGGHPEFIHFIDVMLIVGSANQKTAYTTKLIRGDAAVRRAWACDNLLWTHIDVLYSTVGCLYASRCSVALGTNICHLKCIYVVMKIRRSMQICS